MSAEPITMLRIDMPVEPIEIQADTLPLFSAEMQSKLGEAHLKIPKLLTDHSTVQRLCHRIKQFNAENSLTLTDRAVRFVCTTLAIAAFAHFILGAAIIGQWGMIALGFGTAISSPIFALRYKTKVLEQQRQLGNEFLDVVDFFIENPDSTGLELSLERRFNEVKEYFNKFLNKRYPKVSIDSYTVLQSINPLMPFLDLDLYFQLFISNLDQSNICTEFPNTVRIAFLGILATIYQGLQPGLIGTGALTGLGAASLYMPSYMSVSRKVNDITYKNCIQENYDFFANSEQVEAVLKGFQERIQDAQANGQNTDKLLLAQKEFIRAQKYYQSERN